MGKDAKRAKKMEEKLTIWTKGYVDRNGALRSQTTDAYTALSNSTIQLSCFKLLQTLEESALPTRLRMVIVLSLFLCELRLSDYQCSI